VIVWLLMFECTRDRSAVWINNSCLFVFPIGSNIRTELSDVIYWFWYFYFELLSLKDYWLSQNIFIAYILAVGSSNPLLVHSLIVWQLSPYVRANRKHKKTWIINSDCTVGFITTYMQAVPITTNVVSSNPLRRGVLDTTLCDKVCQWLAAGQWFSLGTRVSSINKTDRQDINEILLKVVLNTITLTLLNMHLTW
jgi:hypothetical protein